MPSLAREPTFLPLTVSAAATAASDPSPASAPPNGRVLAHRAAQANAAAAECWVALLAGCDSPGRQLLPIRLRELSEATAMYAGTRWWYGAGSHHRRRVSESQARIELAVAERDGAEYAEAFVGYDQAVATIVVHVRSRGSHTP